MEQRRNVDAAKYGGISIHELDLSNCWSCTPSYRLLPEDYPIPSASQRSELEAQVLNDFWVSVTSGSEKYSSKHMRKNQYEKRLFKCEDDRFQMDMLLESASSTAKRVEELLKSINDNSISLEIPFRIQDHFTVPDVRLFKLLYGDHGPDTLDLLRRKPSQTLHVILSRLKQKQDEWSKCRLDFSKVWADVYAKNHYKSLDHRSFYFKQQDAKNLSTKSLVSDIKDIKEKGQQEDNVLLAIAASCRHSIIPNLVYEYSDSGIHEDFYNLIKYSSDKICTSKEQSNKVMKLWCTFLEPMLSVPSRPLGSVDSEVASLYGHCGINTAEPSVCKRDEGLVPDAVAMNSQGLKLSSNGEETSSPMQVDSSRVSLLNGDILANEDGFGLQKDRNDAIVDDKIFFTSGTLTSAERATCDAEVANGEETLPCGIGCDPTQGPTNHAAGNSHGFSCKADNVPALELSNVQRSVPNVNNALAESTNIHKHNEDSVDPSKTEKREVELSPNGDFEENNVSAYSGSNSLPNGRKIVKTADYLVSTGEDTSSHDGGGENDANEDGEHSENVSEVGEDVSGSESADDKCSWEVHEEEDGERDRDGKAKSGCEAEEQDDVLTGDVLSLPPSEHLLLTAKPLAKHVTFALPDKQKNSRVFYGNDSFYVLFRLHQILYERLLFAKQHSSAAEMKWRNANDSAPNLYSRFMRALYDLIDGSNNEKFEDDCRAIMGNQSYVLFTLGKLIYKLVNQLQTLASDEIDNKLVQLYEYEKSRRPEKYVDSVYFENAHVLLHNENIYRFECTPAPSQLLIQLMDDTNEKPEVVAVSVDPYSAAYFHEEFLSVVPSLPGIMLQRNKRKYADVDESSAICLALEGVRMINGLERMMVYRPSKIPYVMYTENFFCRNKRKMRKSSTSLHQDKARVQKFRSFSTVLI